MGTVSLTNTDRLLWLGRYAERVYSTVRLFNRYFDEIIDSGDGGADVIARFCRGLDIPNIYPKGENFADVYCFDERDPNSIFSNMLRAYDNAVTLREVIGSEAVSYIQLAVYDLQKARGGNAPLMGMQHVLDHLLAFWGISEDQIPDEDVRNIMKVGRRIERVDLYCRLHWNTDEIKHEISRLKDRLGKSELRHHPEKIAELLDILSAQSVEWQSAVKAAESVLDA